jgi:GNAT superfamily N-acetyltransferase
LEEPASGFAAFAASALGKAGIELRTATPADAALIALIYATTREEELRAVPWTPAQKQAFTDEQSRMQEKHYALHYPNAERLIVRALGEDVGRLYVDTTRAEVRLMEVTLMTAHRNHGIGGRIMEQVLQYADALGLPTSLHVEPFNPARRMYVRMGFEPREARGFYELMVRPVPPS